MVVLLEYLVGRRLYLVRSDKMADFKRQNKNSRQHSGDWSSLKSTAHTRVNDSSVLILFVIHRDRMMQFKRWTYQIDVAINKIDNMAVNTDQQFLIDKRNFLESIKALMESYCSNINHNNLNLPSVSLLDHAQQLMLKIIKKTDAEMSKKSSKSGEPALSSDSENECLDSEFNFREVLRDYISNDSVEGRFLKKLKKKLTDHHIHPLSLDLVPYSDVYRELANEFCSKLINGSAQTYLLNKARYYLCLCAEMILRIGNSSSVLERAFSDSLICVGGRRVRLRKDLI